MNKIVILTEVITCIVEPNIQDNKYLVKSDFQVRDIPRSSDLIQNRVLAEYALLLYLIAFKNNSDFCCYHIANVLSTYSQWTKEINKSVIKSVKVILEVLFRK